MSSVETALARNPQNASFWLLLASLRASQGQRPAALAAVASCLQLSPTNVEALNLQAVLQHQEGEFAAAEDVAAQALALAPESAMAHFNRGLMLETAGALDQARQEFHEAVRLDPDLRPAHTHLARCEVWLYLPVRPLRFTTVTAGLPPADHPAVVALSWVVIIAVACELFFVYRVLLTG